MNNNTTNKSEFQLKSRRELLELTKLSRLPSFQSASAATCVGCGARLERDSEFLQSIRVCKKCLAHYAKVDAAFDEAAKRKKKEILEKFAAGVK